MVKSLPYGGCPGGEEAVLPTVAPKGVAGSNPVPSAKVKAPQNLRGFYYGALSVTI
jgi:hypothetical protein